MDDLEDDVQESEFITDTEDQDSLDERIDSEQRLRNQQLWASFQNVACCITKLYKDRTQPNHSPWIPFQNAASNLTTLYKDCIESQRRFAKIGYQVGRRRRTRDIKRRLKKHKAQQQNKQQQMQHQQQPTQSTTNDNIINGSNYDEKQSDELNSGNVPNGVEPNSNYQSVNLNGVSSILAVDQLNIDCDELPSNSMQVPSSIFQFQELQQSYQSNMQFGSRKRSCPSTGGNLIKRIRE